jgi:hypothetical protein
VTEGDAPIDISVDVDNVGEIQGDQDLELTVENSSGVVFSDTVTGVQVAAGANTTETFTDVPAGTLAPGEYDHVVSSDNDTVEGNLTVETGALFTEPLLSAFSNPPQNVSALGDDPALFEDLNGDGDGTDVDQTVEVFGELIRGNDLNGDGPNGGLTDEQARALNWDSSSPETEVTVADMVELFSEQIRAP